MFFYLSRDQNLMTREQG